LTERSISEGRTVSRLLAVRQVAKPWGRDVLPAPFSAPDGERIGEIWFEPPPELSGLLVKYIFTSEKLSVQVHPSDAQLPGHGKEECWLIVDAEPGACLGIGFREPVGAEAMRAAALDGSIEHLLAWHPVSPGDFFFIPANTVHAIGAGVSLIEVQQNSDVTYRLFDYGRPRELHLDEGVAVASGARYAPENRSLAALGRSVRLVEGPLFRLDQVTGRSLGGIAPDYGDAPLLVIPRDAAAQVGGQEIAPGQCGLADSIAEVVLTAQGTYLLAQPH
jgi:mannose-6-phosphate isomerase